MRPIHKCESLAWRRVSSIATVRPCLFTSIGVVIRRKHLHIGSQAIGDSACMYAKCACCACMYVRMCTSMYAAVQASECCFIWICLSQYWICCCRLDDCYSFRESMTLKISLLCNRQGSTRQSTSKERKLDTDTHCTRGSCRRPYALLCLWWGAC